MTLHEYVTTLRRHWIVIGVAAFLGALVAYGYAQTLPEQFRSKASVIVLPDRGENTTELVQGSNYVQSLVQSYAVVAASPYVLDAVIDDFNLETTASELARRVTIDAPLNTMILDISVVDEDPEHARVTADAIATELSDAVAELSPEGADDRPAVRLETISPGKPPGAPIAPSMRLYAMLGAAAGLALGVGYALVRRLSGVRILDTEDVASFTDVPVIGEIPTAPRGATVANALLGNPDGRLAESFRTLAANFRFVDMDNSINVILIASGSPGEGKSSVAVGLSVALSESGHSVLLIDADLRRPTIADLTQLEGAVGLTNVIVGDLPLADATQPWGHGKLHVLTSGAASPNPGRLIASGQLRKVVDNARTGYDFVVVDSAPLLTVSDPLWLAPLVDGVVVTARAGATRRRALTSTLASVDSTHTTILGIVLNRVKNSEQSAYYEDEAHARLRMPRRLRHAPPTHEKVDDEERDDAGLDVPRSATAREA